MKCKQISVTYGRKFNLGDFNSVHIESTVWAELDEDDIPADSAEILRDFARNQVRDEFKRLARSAEPPAKG